VFSFKNWIGISLCFFCGIIKTKCILRLTTICKWTFLFLAEGAVVGYSFVKKNFKIKNQMTVGKQISRAPKWDQPRFSIFFGLEVTAFTRCNTVWRLLDFGNSNLVTLVGYSFLKKNLIIKNQMTVGKQISRALKWNQPRFFYLFWFRSYGLS